MRIDGVSEETNADGEVTSTFEYFRQPEEELESGIGTTDIKPDVTDLSEEMARSLPSLSTRSLYVLRLTMSTLWWHRRTSSSVGSATGC